MSKNLFKELDDYFSSLRHKILFSQNGNDRQNVPRMQIIPYIEKAKEIVDFSFANRTQATSELHEFNFLKELPCNTQF